MGRKTLNRQVRYALLQKLKIGESRHEAKKQLQAELGKDYHFGMTTEGIHSYETYKTYHKACDRFARWCIEKQGVNKYSKPEDAKGLVIPYMQYRKDSGLSVSTLKTERAALGKLYGEPVNFPLPKRTPENITRSRNPVEMDKHFSEENNKDLITIAQGTGCRRDDEAKSRVGDFVEINGRLHVKILKSKGGRNRVAPILPGMEKDVMKIVETARTEGRERLFDHIHTKMDVHSYRRQYAQELYKTISKDRKLRDELLKAYPPRREPNIKGSTYTTRRKDIPNKTFLRDDLYLVSQALGHNRLDVTVTHYLT